MRREFLKYAHNLWDVPIAQMDHQEIEAGEAPFRHDLDEAPGSHQFGLDHRRLTGLGARDLLVLNQQTFRGSNRDLAASFNAQLVGALTPIAASGVNVHYFDVDSLLNRFRANPTAFGYIAAASTGNCSADPACAPIGYLNGGAAENQYISVDGVHLTGKTNTYVAAFIANQLNAPLTMPVQGDMAQGSGLVFANSLLGRLDALAGHGPEEK